MNILDNMNSVAAIAIGGDGLIHQFLAVLIVGICVGLIYGVGVWFIKHIAAPAIVLTVWSGFFILVGLIVVLNFLLGLGGYNFIIW